MRLEEVKCRHDCICSQSLSSSAASHLDQQQSERRLPEYEVVDFELGLYHTCRPQSHSQNIGFCGNVVWRCDAAHVLEETEKGGR